MRLELREGNVLDAPADALLVAIDGASGGMEGNVARQLRARWGEEAWDEIEGAWELPLPPGRACLAAAPPGGRFAAVVALSILPHDGSVPYRSPAMRAVATSALVHAARLCAAHGAPRIATVLPRGGPRLSADEAFAAVVTALDATADLPDVTLAIWSLVPEHHTRLAALAPAFGLRDAVTP